MGGVSNERALWLSRNILRHEPALRAWLRSRTVPGLDIDDIVQESYARLAALASVEGIRNPKNYLFQIASSVIITHIRRSRVVSIRTASEIDLLSVPSDAPSSERQVEDRDELQTIAKAIASLPTPCRDVFILRRIEGLSQREVGIRLGLSENSVEHHMARGIRFLMDRFGRGGKTRANSSMISKDVPFSDDEPARNKRRD
jgi:RNA polymerase sigma-70 factor (ECF subfamily)